MRAKLGKTLWKYFAANSKQNWNKYVNMTVMIRATLLEQQSLPSGVIFLKKDDTTLTH